MMLVVKSDCSLSRLQMMFPETPPFFFLSCLGTNTYCIKNSRHLSTRLHVDRSEHNKKKSWTWAELIILPGI